MSAYPNTLPSFTTKVDNTDINWAADINRLQDEVAAIATELGTTPKAGFANVAARLQHLQTTKSDVGHTHDERYLRRNLATTKGVVIASTGANDFVGLPPPTEGVALVGAPTQPSGVRWGTLAHHTLPGLGQDDHPHYLTTERHNALSHLTVFARRSLRDLGDVSDTVPNTGDVPKWNGSEYTPQPDKDSSHHSGLTGLGNDDHPQYLTESRHHDRAMHDAIGLTHNSLTGLTAGNPHTQYPRKANSEEISGYWNFVGTRPRVLGSHVVTGPDMTRRIWVRPDNPYLTDPDEVIFNSDIWIRLEP